MAGLRWQEPPGGWKNPKPLTGSSYSDMVAELKDHPGVPAIVKTFPLEKWGTARDLVTAIRIGRLRDFRPAGAFDATSAKEPATVAEGEDPTGEEVVNVYARYVGGDDSSPLPAARAGSATDLPRHAEPAHASTV